MRILVVSDTHGDAWSLHEAIKRQKTAEVVIHLGDGADETESIKYQFPEKMFLRVRGNNDWGSSLPLVNIAELEGKRIFYTHGHYHNVKYTLYNFYTAAREQHADIALFGHTHEPMTTYENGIYIMNPGSLGGMHGSYGIIDITKAGIVTNIIFL